MFAIKKNIPLSKYTTFKIGGPARWFCFARTDEEIKGALEFARRNKLKYFVLGKGSNLLVSDSGFCGIVINVANSSLKLLSCCAKEDNRVACAAGALFSKLVSKSVKNGLTGLEKMAGIPGTVGGAICNNSGAYGESIGDVVEEVTALEIKNSAGGGIEHFEIRNLSRRECCFSYRGSIFRREKKYVIISAVLRLDRGDLEMCRRITAECLARRVERQPLGYPSAGSVFKNPVVETVHIEKLSKRYPEIKDFSRSNFVPAGWLIEKTGLKGKRINGAMISEKHSNFIINVGNAKAEDVVILISLVKQKVRNYFGIQLEEEIEYVGF